MPICIECCHPVPQLYHILHSNKPAPSSSSSSASASASASPNLSNNTATINSNPNISISPGLSTGSPSQREPPRERTSISTSTKPKVSDVRLTQCPHCKKFADKYVEHDFVVLFIDLVLVKPQVYRHLLINRLTPPPTISTNPTNSSLSSIASIATPQRFNPSIIRLAILLSLFDVYLTWSRIESLPAPQTARSPVPTWPIPAQYLYYLLLSVAGTLAQHIAIRILAGVVLPRAAGTKITTATANTNTAAAASASTSGVAISTALIVSSCMKLFPVVMVVWRYEDVTGLVGRGVSWAVAVQNVEALRVLMGGVGYGRAAIMVLGGAWVEGSVKRVILGVGGLGGC